MSKIRDVVDGEVTDYEGQEQPEQEEAPKAEGMTVKPLDSDLRAVAQVMGLDDMERSKYQSEIQTLIRWARTQSKEHTPTQLKWTLRNLSAKLGTPGLAEKMITRAARYAYLDLEGKKLNEEKISLMN